MGIKYWLKLVDQLTFPFLQDHAFYILDLTTDYGEIVEIIADEQNYFSSPREHLIALTLNNFIEFAQRTSLEFTNYRLDRRQSKISANAELKAMAEDDFGAWLNGTLSSTFNRIITILFPEKNLSDLTYAFLLFEWINRVRLDSETSYMEMELNRIMKVLRPIFQSRLNASPASCSEFLGSITVQNCNWNSLGMLVECWEENQDVNLRDAILEKYCDYLSSSFFSWHIAGSNSNEVINQAYAFAVLLFGYKDYKQRWKTLFEKYKIHYEGWKRNNGSLDIEYRRTCYLLVAGVGLAYLLYERDEPAKASEILIMLVQITLEQYRAQPDDNHDYLLPLKFIVFVKAKFCKPELHTLLSVFTIKIDHIRFLLEIWKEARTQTNEFYITEALKEQLKQRINTEFEILEMELRYPHQKDIQNEYRKIKDELLKL